MSKNNDTASPYARQVFFVTWFGMLFDGMDTSIYILTLFPSLSELLQTTSHAQVGASGAIILALFMLGWALGAIGFGVLADTIGRAKTLVFTVILYALCTGLCATSHNWQELALFRFLVGCGIGGEISIGAVMLAETWQGNSRLHATGLLQTAFSCGVLLLAAINLVIGHYGWRYLYIFGTLPAVLALYMRLSLKESPHMVALQAYRQSVRRQTKANLSGAQLALLRFPLFELFDRRHLAKTLILVVLASTVCVGNYAVLAWMPAWINQLTGYAAVQERSMAMLAQNIGALIAALLGGYTVMLLGRPWSFRLAFLGGLISCLFMFLTRAFGPALLSCTFVVGFFVMAPFTYLFIYVPELFETRLRATAFAFSIQFGRIFAGLAALLSGQLISFFGGSYAAAGACVSGIFLVGIIASFFMPRTSGVVSRETIPELVNEANLMAVPSPSNG